MATKPIAAGEMVERSPVLPIAMADSECPGLNDYAFAWGEDVPGFEPARNAQSGWAIWASTITPSRRTSASNGITTRTK